MVSSGSVSEQPLRRKFSLNPQNESMEVSMTTRKFQDGEVQLDDLAGELERMDRDSAGQAGDNEGLSPIPDASAESVEELAAAEQAFEAEAVAGVEDAA